MEVAGFGLGRVMTACSAVVGYGNLGYDVYVARVWLSKAGQGQVTVNWDGLGQGGLGQGVGCISRLDKSPQSG